MNKTMKTVKKVWNIISIVIVVLAVIFAVMLVGVRLIGLDVRYVMSGSMEPEYPTGSLIYIRKVDPHTDLEVGDVITYALSSDDVSTHRITRIVPGTEMIDSLDHMPLRFEVKGDANPAPDGTLVLCGNIIGEPVFKIPYLGYLASYIQTEQGRLMAISVGAVLLLLVFLPDLLFDDKDADKKKKMKGGKADAEDNTDSADGLGSAEAAADNSESPETPAEPAKIEKIAKLDAEPEMKPETETKSASDDGAAGTEDTSTEE